MFDNNIKLNNLTDQISANKISDLTDNDRRLV